MAKFEEDKKTVQFLLSLGSDNLTEEQRAQLLKIYQVPYHDSGKIEGMYSCDSSCNACSFCQIMRMSGANNPLCICNYCYDNMQEKRWQNVKNRHALQLEIMSSVEFTEQELATLKIRGLCRFNSSGDIANYIMAKNYLLIAKSHPDVFFGLFAKNTLPVIVATDNIGKLDNIKYIQSSTIIGRKIPKLAHYFDVQFVVYPDEISLQQALASGAEECNGKKCIDCGFRCYLPENNGGWTRGAVIAELLRLKNKQAMENVIKAFYKA